MKVIKSFCIWFLTKYYPPEIKKMDIENDGVEIELKGFIKPNEDWQHVSYNISFWLKAEKKTRYFSEVAVFSNGLKTEDVLLLANITSGK